MNIYIYPARDLENPYIENVIDTLESETCFVLNKNKTNKYGILDLLMNILKVDTYYLNWPENLADRRFGFLQSIAFVCIFTILKLFNKKIIWMMHNKISHSKKGLLSKIVIFYILINKSDIVLTHAKEGISFGNTFLKNKRPIYYFPHPFENKMHKIKKQNEKNIDILIWGSISPYKGIDTFLEYLDLHALSNKYKIHIVGKISDEKLKNRLEKYENKNIIIEDTFVDENELEQLFSRTKLVLLTYAGYSTLASGALMDTLSYGVNVIGPDVGAFRDLREEGLIKTFSNYDDLIVKIDESLSENKNNAEKSIAFILKHSWENFGQWLCKIIRDKR